MRILFKNLFSLGFVQAIGILIPIILTPYIVTKVGISNYGIVVTAQGFVLLFNVLTDLGFNVTSVRDIAANKEIKFKLEQIVNNVFFLKIGLLFLSFFFFLLLVAIIPQFRESYIIYILSFTMVLGQALLPIWYFQGIEQINKTVFPVLFGKVLSVIGILYFVRSESDAIFVNLFLGLGTVFSALYLLVSVFKNFHISPVKTNKMKLMGEVKNNLPIFISNVGVFAYSNSSTLLLSFFVRPEIVGLFNIADKIVQLGKSMLLMIHQVTYTRLCALIASSHFEALDFLKNVYKIIWSGVFLLCLTIYLFSYEIVAFFVTDVSQISKASEILKNLSLLLFVISLNMPFYQTLLAFKRDWIAVRVILSCSVLSLLLNFLLLPRYQIQGLVFTMYFVELLVTLFLFISVRFQKNKLYVV